MKIIDVSFKLDFIKSLIGQKFLQYRCSPFLVRNSVMSIVDLYINDQKYNLVNFEQAADYFGELDDVAIFEFKEKTPNFEFLDGDDYTNTPINLFISGIELT